MLSVYRFGSLLRVIACLFCMLCTPVFAQENTLLPEEFSEGTGLSPVEISTNRAKAQIVQDLIRNGSAPSEAIAYVEQLTPEDLAVLSENPRMLQDATETDSSWAMLGLLLLVLLVVAAAAANDDDP